MKYISPKTTTIVSDTSSITINFVNNRVIFFFEYKNEV